MAVENRQQQTSKNDKDGVANKSMAKGENKGKLGGGDGKLWCCRCQKNDGVSAREN
jgi:hypothetical protein